MLRQEGEEGKPMTRKQRIERIERIGNDRWLESLSDEVLLVLIGVPHATAVPLSTLSNEDLLRLFNGEEVAKVLHASRRRPGHLAQQAREHAHVAP
jgi:hypothetical protein